MAKKAAKTANATKTLIVKVNVPGNKKLTKLALTAAQALWELEEAILDLNPSETKVRSVANKLIKECEVATIAALNEKIAEAKTKAAKKPAKKVAKAKK